MSADDSDEPKGRLTLPAYVGPLGPLPPFVGALRPPTWLSEVMLRVYPPTDVERGAAAERAAILAWLDRDIELFKASDDPYLSEVDDIWNDARVKLRESIAAGAHLAPRSTP